LVADKDRYDDLRTRRYVAGDVIGKGVDVVDDDGRALRCGCTADAAAGRQTRACWASAKRSEHEFIRRLEQVETGPVDVGELVIE